MLQSARFQQGASSQAMRSHRLGHAAQGVELEVTVHVSPSGWPALVLNADFRPLSYYPLSLWSWQDAIKAVFLDRVNIVEHYDRAVHSPTFEMKLPSVVSLKTFVKPTVGGP